MFRAIVVEKDAESSDRGRPNRAELREIGDEQLDVGLPDGAETGSDSDSGTGTGTAPEPIELLDIDVAYSSVNYKDALALTGRPGIIRGGPLVPGIDLVGTVTSSRSARFAEGDVVLLNGAGIGETRNGGLAERARVDAASVVALPEGVSAERAAAIGTAGFTAMLSVVALERQEVATDAGDVLVTGAAGGVGSIAVAVLAKLGYTVTASTGRVEEQGGFLRSLGAASVIDRAELQEAGKPLQNARWAGVVDTVGSHTLANALAQTRWGGTVTACGLAQGADLPATVMPFILRAVTLVGINSVEAPLAARERAWARLATDLDQGLLDSLTETVALTDAFDAAERVLAGRVRGRTVVALR